VAVCVCVCDHLLCTGNDLVGLSALPNCASLTNCGPVAAFFVGGFPDSQAQEKWQTSVALQGKWRRTRRSPAASLATSSESKRRISAEEAVSILSQP